MATLNRLLLVLIVIECSTANCTESATTVHSRLKRWITFYPNGGTAKLVMGCIVPIKFHHKLFRQINMIYNFQANYNIPANIIWPVPSNIFKVRGNNDYVDQSRGQLYRLLEKMIDELGSNGRECVLRAICEVAEAPLSDNGMIGEIIDVVFTPYDSDEIDEAYRQAKANGSNGADCVQLYRDCPFGHGLLEKVSVKLLV
ncbi:uncharacterized protein LOC131679748 [Topomyia yanbarensis]|uniref:uncharacterized protein LOC131679748 n=1 Tax=Topomyia yanbarensis TaxID=2498891 RepID=UPI00273A8B34|nr:uncharacterized protein LOC131679748 [Topomyia yanbarensis]